jgi:hypothetical protein
MRSKKFSEIGAGASSCSGSFAPNFVFKALLATASQLHLQAQIYVTGGAVKNLHLL